MIQSSYLLMAYVCEVRVDSAVNSVESSGNHTVPLDRVWCQYWLPLPGPSAAALQGCLWRR